MSTSWSEVASMVGKRLLQIVAVVLVEELARWTFTTAFDDEDEIRHEKPRQKRTKCKPKETPNEK